MSVALKTILGVFLRHGLGALGMAGALSNDEMNQFAGAIMFIGSICVSLYQKREQLKAR